jgi:8-amino-7-oxononanoate synthase
LNEQYLHQALEKRKAENALRKLIVYASLTDFCSNDYLGFACSEELAERIANYKINEISRNGSTGSRLLAGNSAFAEELEQFIATYHKAESALIYNSGYDANVGLFSCVPQRGDSIIYDELVHASIHDGMRLSKADCFKFSHNDVEHLIERLQHAKGTVFVAIESVYSMDGDSAPLNKIATICEQHNANLIVDEAHATGVFGDKGEGCVVAERLEDKVFARVHTYGKALGCHGAAIFGSKILKEYLINFSRSFIYTTALPIHSLVSIQCAYDLLTANAEPRLKVKKLINVFKQEIAKNKNLELIESDSAVQCIVFGGNDKVKTIAKTIQDKGFDVRAILSPTVARGKERLRICLHAFNTEEEVQLLVNQLSVASLQL